jgi:hypothetical protein
MMDWRDWVIVALVLALLLCRRESGELVRV